MQEHALKEHQRESLDEIARFCGAVRRADGDRAVRPVHDAYCLETRRDFIEVPQLPGAPYFCLRVPASGGNTLIAAHSVGAIAKTSGRVFAGHREQVCSRLVVAFWGAGSWFGFGWGRGGYNEARDCCRVVRGSV